MSRLSPRRVMVVGGALCLTALVVVGLALTWRPTWYRPPKLDANQVRADKAALVHLQDEISGALNTGKPIRFRLTTDQINRWLAMRAELWPEVNLPGTQWDDPCISIDDNAIRVGVTVRSGSWGAVVSLTCRVSVASDTVIVVTEQVRVGAMTVPRGWLSVPREVRASLERAGGGIDDRGVIRVPNDWVWPNGKRRFRVTEFGIERGALQIAFEP